MTGEKTNLGSGATQIALSPGARLKHDRYEIRDIVCRGSSGITYRAWDFARQVEVAIKEYLPLGFSAVRDRNGTLRLGSGDRDFRRGLECFLKEYRTFIRFHHRNIVRGTDVFKANGTGCMVMEYESGEDLIALLRRYPRVNEKWILTIVFPLLEGLRALHTADILHRDIMPANIIVRPDQSPCLFEPGTTLPRSSKLRLSSSSLNYAPPEPFGNQGLQGPWMDIYSLGAVCYRIISGRPPCSVLERLDAVRARRPDPLQSAREVGRGRYRRGFLKAIDHALALDPAQRPQSISEWREMVVPTGADPHTSDRKNGSLLGKLRNLFGSSGQRPLAQAGGVGRNASAEVIAVSAGSEPQTEPDPAPLHEEDTISANSIDHLSGELGEPDSSTEVCGPRAVSARTTLTEGVGYREPVPLPAPDLSALDEEATALSLPPEVDEYLAYLSKDRGSPEKSGEVVASLRKESAELQPVAETLTQAPVTDELTLPEAVELCPPAAVEPNVKTAKASAKEASATPEDSTGTPIGEIERPIDELDAVSTPIDGVELTANSRRGLDKPIETDGLAAASQFGGTVQSPLPSTTPPQDAEPVVVTEPLNVTESPTETEVGLIKSVQIGGQSSTTKSLEPARSALSWEAPPQEKELQSVDDFFRGVERQTTTDRGLNTVFQSSWLSPGTQPAGIKQSTPFLETSPEKTGWSHVFEPSDHPQDTASDFLIERTGVEDSDFGASPESPKVDEETAISKVTNHNDRAWRLFREQDYAGALAALEVARALEPENPVLLANIKRIKRQLQDPSAIGGDPWATS